MRYLLLSILVVSLVGVLVIPVNFASAHHICEPPAIIQQSDEDDDFIRYLECFKQNPNIVLTYHPIPEGFQGTNQDMKLATILSVVRSYSELGDVENTIYYHSMMSNLKNTTPEIRTILMLMADSQLELLAKECYIDGTCVYKEERPQQTTEQTEYIKEETQQIPQQVQQIQQQSKGGGCLIATAAFGSEMAPQVQFLREIRDNTVLQTESGSAFMTGFNHFYYSFSPAIADYERENPAFKEAVKITLTPLLTSLTLLQYADIDSESEMLGYGIGVILLNIGMYFVAPAVLIMKVRSLTSYNKIPKTI